MCTTMWIFNIPIPSVKLLNNLWPESCQSGGSQKGCSVAAPDGCVEAEKLMFWRCVVP